ncbi:MAG: ATP-dependent Clp protease proteolytic subunit [Rhizobiales bacterium]|nr:ATP-dependent Clp protease proteolytic subunit [Hyphomicrobiales bacterium]
MVGITLRTPRDEPSLPAGSMAIEYEGAIVFPLAENLLEIWKVVERQDAVTTIILNLNSKGGLISHGEKVISLLSAIRQSPKTLITLVENGHTCASMCIPIYVQGERRIAFPASSWMLHGARKWHSNVPNVKETRRVFDHLRERDITPAFLDRFFANGYHKQPGELWLSGRELFSQSNIILKLLPNWQSMQPQSVPFWQPLKI